MNARAKQILWTVKRHVWGPVGSVVFHVALLTVLLQFAGSTLVEKAPNVEAVIMEPTASKVELDTIDQRVEQLQELPTVVDAIAPPTVSMDAPPMVDTVASTLASGVGTGVGTGVGDGPAGAGSGDVGLEGPGLGLLPNASPLVFKGLYQARGSGSARGTALREYSGGLGERTEYGVKKALNWLRDHQYPDGSWGPNYRAAMTGLALLSLFAHGETTSSPEYGQAIKKGLMYLLKIQQKNGIFSTGGPYNEWEQPATAKQVESYEHAIATYAMSEAYGLTRIPFLKVSMEKAVQAIIDGQHAAGSWDYGYVQGPDAQKDVSLSGWHLQALESAMLADAENKGLKTAIENGVHGLKLLWSKELSMFQYSTRAKEPPSLSMTGVAVLCLELVGHAMDNEARAGMVTLRNANFRWTKGDQPNEDKRGMGIWPFYAWYYITQARFHQGGQAWASWNRVFAPTLARMQNPDGSWCPAPESLEEKFGPVYCTTLGALMLEVYYRFLPTYKPIAVEKEAVEGVSGEGDIVIKFG